MTGERNGLPELTTGEHPCPYLDDRNARTAFVDPRLPFDGTLYRRLLDRGYRRSGPYLYRPACPACQACQSLRIPVAAFRPRRRHRRNRRDNADLARSLVRGGFREEHYQLYERYVTQRHPGGGMDQPKRADYAHFLFADWCESVCMELRDADHGLVGVAVMDHLPGALSAVYTFYEPGLTNRGLGTHAILRQIELAHEWGYDWLYLGYWIEDCQRMAYKGEFRPHDIHTTEGWVRRD